jgi:hypothetical protein
MKKKVLIYLNDMKIRGRILHKENVGESGPKRGKISRRWIKLYNEELHNLYSSPNIIRMIKSRRMRWVGRVARMGEKRNAYIISVRRPEGKRGLGRPRRKLGDNIKMDVRELG